MKSGFNRADLPLPETAMVEGIRWIESELNLLTGQMGLYSLSKGIKGLLKFQAATSEVCGLIGQQFGWLAASSNETP